MAGREMKVPEGLALPSARKCFSKPAEPGRRKE